MKKIETLELVDVSKSFQGVVANERISLHVSSGEILGLLGEKRCRENHVDEYPLWDLSTRWRRNPDQR